MAQRTATFTFPFPFGPVVHFCHSCVCLVRPCISARSSNACTGAGEYLDARHVRLEGQNTAVSNQRATFLDTWRVPSPHSKGWSDTYGTGTRRAAWPPSALSNKVNNSGVQMVLRSIHSWLIPFDTGQLLHAQGTSPVSEQPCKHACRTTQANE